LAKTIITAHKLVIVGKGKQKTITLHAKLGRNRNLPNATGPQRTKIRFVFSLPFPKKFKSGVKKW